MRLPTARAGVCVTVRQRAIPFSYWPMREARHGRYRLQSLLFSLDPWAVIEQTIKKECPVPAKAEALACLNQAKDFFTAASEAGVLEARPLTLYYSYMNLVKAFCLTRGQQPTFDKAQHGLSEKLATGGQELTGAFLKAFPSPNAGGELQNFAEFMRAIKGTGLSAVTDFKLPDLLPQIVPGHRLWAAAANRTERFVAVHSIDMMHSDEAQQIWINIYLVAEDLTRLGLSHSALLTGSGLSATFREVTGHSNRIDPIGKKLLCFEQINTMQCPGYPADRLNSLAAAIRPLLWTTVSIVSPYRRYYLYVCPANERASLLPQLLSIYAISYYLGSITRYRPHHYPSIAQGVFGPRIQDFVSGQPSQFLYLMASEFARQEISKPAIL